MLGLRLQGTQAGEQMQSAYLRVDTLQAVKSCLPHRVLQRHPSAEAVQLGVSALKLTANQPYQPLIWDSGLETFESTVACRVGSHTSERM